MTAFGYDPIALHRQGPAGGAALVLYKPFRVDQLLDALEKPDVQPAPSPSQPEVVRA